MDLALCADESAVLSGMVRATTIGAFHEIDPDMTVTWIADVINEPGNRYMSIFGLADPTFPKNRPFSRWSDAGKLMALASFSIP
jgi:hypothetical protein